MIFTTMELLASLGMISLFIFGNVLVFKAKDIDSKGLGFLIVAITTAVYIAISFYLK